MSVYIDGEGNSHLDTGEVVESVLGERDLMVLAGEVVDTTNRLILFFIKVGDLSDAPGPDGLRALASKAARFADQLDARADELDRPVVDGA